MRPFRKWGILAVLFASRAATAFAQPAPAASPVPLTPDQSLERAIDLYEKGEYALAAKELDSLLYPPPVGFDPDKKRRAHLYRGISLFLLQERDAADREFWQVLLSDPEFKPDPLFTPAAVISAFDRLRTENADELRKVPRVRRPERPRDPLGIPLEPVTGGGDFWRGLVPFGGAQFHNKQPAKAYVVLGAETSLLATNLATAAALQTLQNEEGRFDPEDVEQARLLKNLNNASFFLFGATLVYGTLDGMWFKYARPRRPTDPVITPAVGPGTAGLLLTVEF